MNDKEKMELFKRRHTADWDTDDSAIFVGAAIEDFEKDFYGRLVAERMVKEMACSIALHDRDIKFVLELYRSKALASLAEEGIEIKEEEK